MRKSTQKADTKKKPWASRIRRLRDSLAATQEKFAEMVLVTRTAVLHWEHGNVEPAADTYFRIGSLAMKHGEDPTWFWQKAGLDTDKLVEEFTKRASERYAAFGLRGKNNISVVPLLKTIESASKITLRADLPDSEVEKFISLSRDLVPNPAFTACLRVPNDLSSLGRDPLYDANLKKHVEREFRYRSDPESSEHPYPLREERTRDLRRPMFRRGDIAIIDLSTVKLDDLTDRLVAFSFSPSTEVESPTLYIGWLRLNVGLSDDDPRLQKSLVGRRWNSADEKWVPHKLQTYEEKVVSYRRLGVEPPEPQRTYSYYLFCADYPDECFPITDNVSSSSVPSLTITNGYRILGRVIGWIAGSQ